MKFNKNITWIYFNAKKTRKYIKYYKMKNENAKMIIIMWEKVWNDNRGDNNIYIYIEREREREMFATVISRTAKESKIFAIANLKRA